MPAEVVEVRRLLDDLAAAPVDARATRRARASSRASDRVTSPGGPLGEPLAQLRQRLEAAEVVADRDDEPAARR